MKVSVIVPVYNTSQLLTRCLDSIRDQTYTDWECILIDDGSTDTSLDIMRGYIAEDSRFKIVSQANSGVSVARNKGLDMACGEYVTFIDSDDYVDLSYFQQVVDLLKLYDVSMLISGYSENSDGAGCRMDKCSRLPEWVQCVGEDISLLDRVSCARLLFDGSASYWGYIRNWFRRSLIVEKNLVFDKRLKYNEDRAFTLSYLSVEPSDAVNIVFNRPNYHYEIRGGSTMSHGFNVNHLVELESFKHFCGIERAYFRSRSLNMAIRHAGLTRKFYLTWLAMNMERYDDKIAAAMERIEEDMLSIRDFIPPYTLHSRPLMKRWLQHHKYKFMRFIGRQR